MTDPDIDSAPLGDAAAAGGSAAAADAAPTRPARDVIARVQRSFARIASPERFAARFYHQLFNLRPDVRPLFANSLAEQQYKLASTLAVVVDGLDHFDTLRGTVAALGRSHVAYGVSEAHYAAVGAALLWSLDTEPAGLRSEERDAWIEVYGFVSTVMMRAARAPDPAPAP